MFAVESSFIVPAGRSSVPFSDPRQNFDHGLVAVGGKLDVATLFKAYSMGIFPWPQEGLPLLWFCPDKRGVLEFSDFHIPKKFQKKIVKEESTATKEYEYSVNSCFEEVIQHCQSQPRPGQDGTWILPEMVRGYTKFHHAGYAHSFEVWKNKKLVGGLYGVLVQGVFAGESMFHLESDASKRALIYAVETLHRLGLKWMDTQMVSPLVATFGGVEISKLDFLNKLSPWPKAKGS